MKYFITDIHGEYKGLELLLKHAEIDFATDQLVIGGDMINRGKESGRVIKKLKALVDKYPKNVVALIGNHEEMMRNYLRSGDTLWLSHGGKDTMRDLEKTFPNEATRQEYMVWACNLPMVFEDDEFVYTHAGLNPYEPINKQNRDILWMSETDFYSLPKEALITLTRNKPVVHGHTPVERIYFDGVRLNCDLGSNTYSVMEERGLCLMELDRMIYYVYKQSIGKIEERKVIRY